MTLESIGVYNYHMPQINMYIVTRYWDNDEPAENFESFEKPIAVFDSSVKAVAYINNLSKEDILLHEVDCFDIVTTELSVDETVDGVIFYKAFGCKENEAERKKKAIKTMMNFHVYPEGDNWKEWDIPDERNIVYYVYKLGVNDGK